MPMKRLNLLLALLFPFLIFSQNSFLLDDSTTVFINEIHYDILGADNLEGIEIAALSGTDLSCYKVYFVVGISENENHLMNVYPNPIGANLSIKASGFGESSTIQAEVFNAFGQVVHREAFESHSTEIQQKFNLEHFEKGIYFISIKSGDKLSRKRFVIH